MKGRSDCVYLVAGEASGDVHAAVLMENVIALAGGAPIFFEGLGGPRMATLGDEGIEDWIETAGVVGLVEVLKHYGYFRRKFRATRDRIVHLKPAVVVLVDYPGFNLRLAKALRKEGYHGTLAYYISPQVWAWNRARIPRMAEWLDLMLCIFPFEQALYEASGLKTVFVGHPLVESLPPRAASVREENLIGFFPGSREREVAKHLPVMMGAAQRLVVRNPSLSFEVACASPRLERRIRDIISRADVQIGIADDGAHRLMQRATIGAVASGTATLEAAWFGLPYCLIYKVAWPTYWVGKAVVRVPYLGIVNLLAGRELVSELIQGAARPERIADVLWTLLEDRRAREQMQAGFAQVVAPLGDGGASRRAAEAILQLVNRK